MCPHPQLVTGDYHISNGRVRKNVFRRTFFRGKAGSSNAQQHCEHNQYLFHKTSPSFKNSPFFFAPLSVIKLFEYRSPAVLYKMAEQRAPNICFTVNYSTDMPEKKDNPLYIVD
jgi:hypothetical protein